MLPRARSTRPRETEMGFTTPAAASRRAAPKSSSAATPKSAARRASEVTSRLDVVFSLEAPPAIRIPAQELLQAAVDALPLGVPKPDAPSFLSREACVMCVHACVCVNARAHACARVCAHVSVRGCARARACARVYVFWCVLVCFGSSLYISIWWETPIHRALARHLLHCLASRARAPAMAGFVHAFFTNSTVII